ncbi:MAG: diguanylate cyclase [Spirochaetales bacterium]|nr:diguanylate cyclase [Spirochaetales bacterium]
MDYSQVIKKFRKLGLFIQDVEQDHAYPNDLWEEWGYGEEDMVGKNFLDFIHPEDRPRVEKAMDNFITDESGFLRVVFRIEDKKGKWRWLLTTCLAVERDDEGRITQYVGFDHDITEEMEAKARAETALKEAETLISANGAITARLDLPHTISAILEQAGRVLSFDSSSVQLIREKNGVREMKIVGGVGFPEKYEVIGARFPITSRIPNSRIMVEKDILVLDKEELAGYTDFYDHAYRDILYWMGVPLICKDRLLGMIAFDRLENLPFTEHDIRLARAFAGQVAVALDNSQLFEETRQLAITDPLTGCFSRRWMYSELEKECEASHRHKHDLSLILLDIDHFKRINDTYGHLIGDEILKKMVNLLDRVLRKSDLLFRVGGEEFIILLPYEKLSDAVEVADRIRVLLERELALESMDSPVTVSLGCAQYRDADRDGIDDFISRADRAMYLSKRKGRNRVSFLE